VGSGLQWFRAWRGENVVVQADEFVPPGPLDKDSRLRPCLFSLEKPWLCARLGQGFEFPQSFDTYWLRDVQGGHPACEEKNINIQGRT